MSCSCFSNQIAPAIITVTPALGSTASPFLLEVQVVQRLCFSACKEQVPTFAPEFNVLSVASVGGSMYVATCQCQGAINYIRCGGGCLCTAAQPVNTTFTIPFYSATAPTSLPTLTKVSTANAVETQSCKVCGKDFVSDNFLTLTIA
jgi:hypothetical protein